MEKKKKKDRVIEAEIIREREREAQEELRSELFPWLDYETMLDRVQGAD